MVRTQILLTEEQAARLRRMAAERGVSLAAVVREAVDRLIEQPDREAAFERALAAVGRFRSDRDDVAVNHDRYLAEIYHQT